MVCVVQYERLNDRQLVIVCGKEGETDKGRKREKGCKERRNKVKKKRKEWKPEGLV